MPSSNPFVVVTFYRFVTLPDFKVLKSSIFSLAQGFGIRGTVLLAEEGINSTISGHENELACFLEWLESDPRFTGLERKFSTCDRQPFERLKVRLKKEIVRMNSPEARPDVAVGEYIEPERWNQVIQNSGTLVIDVRNRYETELGTFEGAIDPETDEFGQFPRFVEQNLTDKEQPLALFCTGGIRCEKATAYLVHHGYKNVMHLKGGILNYLEKMPVEESLWKGTCFVFDQRRELDHDLVESPKDAVEEQATSGRPRVRGV